MHCLILSRLPNIPVCTRPPRSAPGSLARSPLHRVVHKIQCPFLVRRSPNSQRLPHSHAVFPLLSPNAQPRLPVDSVEPLMVPLLSHLFAPNPAAADARSAG